MAVGQFYAVSADMRRPYYVCGGLQDNGSWCGPSAVRGGQILNTDWYRIGGGDGFYTQNDPTDWTIGYSESQDGATNRYDLRTGRSQSIRPRPPQPAQPRPERTARSRRSCGWRHARRTAGSPAGRRTRRRRERQYHPATACGDAVPVLLEHPLYPVAARSADPLPGRRPAFQIRRPGQHLHRILRT